MRICFLDRSTKLETVNDLETKPRGGMVSSLFKVSDYLASRGHEVWTLTDIKTPGETKAGVKWFATSNTHFPYPWRSDREFDFLICNRGVGGFDIKAKHRILWTHDLPHAGHISEPKNIKAFSVVFMSKYAERIWRYYYKDIGRSFLIPNGVDKDIFYPREKDLNYLIYASAPNRGLKRLPLIFDSIETRVKRPVYMRAYSNLAKLHPNEVDEKDDLAETYNAVRESKVTLCDPIPQKELAEELGSAGLMVVPSAYPEICSNSILQSIASGTPVVTTGSLGSAGEWVSRRNGALTQWQPHDYMAYTLNVVRESVRILENEKLHRKLIKNAAKTKIYTWDQIGAQWQKMLKLI